MALLESERYADAELQYRALLPSADLTNRLAWTGDGVDPAGKSHEARTVLEPVLMRGESAEAQFALGQVLFPEGQLDKALEVHQSARALPHVRLAIGAVLWRQRKIDAAVAEWRAEYGERPDNFLAIYMRGAALSLNPDHSSEAESLLRKAISLRPGNPRANFQLAKMAWQISKNPEAVVFLKRATQADPDFREAFFLHGNILHALGRRIEANKSFARVKEISAKKCEHTHPL